MTSPKPTDSEQLVAEWMESLGFRLRRSYRDVSIKTWYNDTNDTFYPAYVPDDLATFFYRTIHQRDQQRLSAWMQERATYRRLWIPKADVLSAVLEALPKKFPEVGVTQSQIDYARGFNASLVEISTALTAALGTKHEHWCHINKKPARNESEAGAVDPSIGLNADAVDNSHTSSIPTTALPGNGQPDAQAEVGLRERVALIEQRLANCSILHSQDNSDAEWIDGVCITPTLAVQEIMALFQADKAAAVTEELQALKNLCMMPGTTVSGLNRVIGTHLARLQPPTAGEGERV